MGVPSSYTLHDSATQNQVSAPDITSASASYTIRMTYMQNFIIILPVLSVSANHRMHPLPPYHTLLQIKLVVRVGCCWCCKVLDHDRCASHDVSHCRPGAQRLSALLGDVGQAGDGLRGAARGGVRCGSEACSSSSSSSSSGAAQCLPPPCFWVACLHRHPAACRSPA